MKNYMKSFSGVQKYIKENRLENSTF